MMLAGADKGVQAETAVDECNSPSDRPAPGSDGERFEARTLKQTFSSVTIDWQRIPDAEVYRIEKFHRRNGWTQVGWTAHPPCAIDGLDENFTYRIRILALTYCPTREEYVVLTTSEDFMVTTLPAPPTTENLFRAIRRGQHFLAKQMIRRRPSLIEHPGPNGCLPLANAIIYGQNSIIDTLMTEMDASLQLGSPHNGRTPLHYAFFHGRLPLVRILINKKVQLEATDMDGATACHLAIDANQLEMLKFALENGANLEAADSRGWTLLMRAVVMRADMPIVKLVTLQGANLEARDWLGKSCIDLARLYNNNEALVYFERVQRARGLASLRTVK